MTHTSENPAAAAARHARALERQARVGILRNPNAPPRPPQRKARLTGKWPSLQSTRRPQSPPPPVAAQTISDTDLARLMKAALTLPDPRAHQDTGTTGHDDADTTVTPLPDSATPTDTLETPSRPPGDALKPFVLLVGSTALIALTLLAAVW